MAIDLKKLEEKFETLFAKETEESFNNYLKTKTMAQQTAVEWLKKELEDYGSNSHLSLDWNTFDELCEQAKAIEKEQIQKAFSDGQETPINHPTLPHYSNEEYYNETFGNNVS